MSVKYKIKEVQTIDKILCDLCATNCTEENALLHADWGYNSKKDGLRYRVNLCENCFDSIINWMKDRRYPYIFTSSNDPLNGIS